MAERLEETVGAAPAEVSKAVKAKFVAMVEEGQYLTRVKPPSAESALGHMNSEERPGDSARMPIFGKFELPSSLTGKWRNC